MITTNFQISIEALTKNKLVGISTKTVSGLTGNAYYVDATYQIFSFKKSSYTHPLIVHIKSKENLNEVSVNTPESALQLIKKFRPGTLTWILKKGQKMSNHIIVGRDTVAIRMPNHALTLALLQQLNFTFVAANANPFDALCPTIAIPVLNYFKEDLPIHQDGAECLSRIDSTIVEFENNMTTLYRRGPISIEQVEEIVDKVIIITYSNNESVQTITPGMSDRHYSLQTAIYLAENLDELISKYHKKKISLLVVIKRIHHRNIARQEVHSVAGDFQEATRNLFASVHHLDSLNLDIIIAERLPGVSIGNSFNNRLIRATK